MQQKDLIILFACSRIEDELRAEGFEVLSFEVLSITALRKAVNLPTALIISDAAFKQPHLPLSEEKGKDEYIQSIRKLWPIVDIIYWSPNCSAALALKMVKAGVREIVLEDNPNSVLSTLEDMLKNQMILPRLSRQSRKQKASSFEGIVSREQKMWDIFDDVKRTATTNANILILGETGTGKELMARAIHRLSQKPGRFVAVNCAAIPENLIDSELFGHVKGAFTDAHSEKKGLFRYGEGGTIFLDEIGNMPMSSQHHLLRVLQENTIRPVGAHEEIPIKIRVLAATSRPLEEFVERGLFREDLLYRLDVVRLILPPLRERGDDIVFLFSHFAQKFAKEYHIPFPTLTDSFLDELNRYSWPGNVRQLANIVERLMLTHPGEKLTVSHLRQALKPYRSAQKKTATHFPIDLKNDDIDIRLSFEETVKPALAKLEQSYYIKLLQSNRGGISKTAEKAGISRRTLLRKMKSWGLEKKHFKMLKEKHIEQ